MRKAVSMISAVMFFAVTIAITAIVYQSTMPTVKKMQDTASVEKMKDGMARLDEVIRQVASEGKGSKRTVTLQLDTGKLVVNKTNDFIDWKMETEAQLISPRTSQQFGNLVIGSNLESSADEANFSYGGSLTPAYLLENDHLKVYVKKIGSEESHASYSTSDLVLGVYNKDNGQWIMDPGFFRITLDSHANSGSGTGYTKLIRSGYNLPYAEVMAFMNSTYLSYYINMTLESGTDFLILSGSM